MLQQQKIWIVFSILLCVFVFNNPVLAETATANATAEDLFAIAITEQDNAQNNQQIATTQHEIQPRQSMQSGVSADQLLLKSPVVDQAKILSAEEERQLSEKIQNIYKRGLAQIAIVIVSTTNGQNLADYSQDIFDRWKLGKKGIDNGLLITVAINDRDMRIQTGYGLEGVIPDAIAKRIIVDDIAPSFKQGNYAEGLMNALNKIETRLTTDPEILKQADAKEEDTIIDPFTIAIFFFFVGIVFVDKFGRFVGASISAVLAFFASYIFHSFGISLFIAVGLWLWLVVKNGSSIGFDSGGYSYSEHDDNDRYGGGGGYSGGGGSSGGGGAGGSW